MVTPILPPSKGILVLRRAHTGALIGGTGLSAAALIATAGFARLAHFGPFAEDLIRNADVAAMTGLEFRASYFAMRDGTYVERTAVETACALFTSMLDTGAPPPEWNGFEATLKKKLGPTDSSDYAQDKLDSLAATVALAQHNPRAAQVYAQTCL